MAVILLVDDHPLFRDGFAQVARSLRPAWRLSFADSAAQALDTVGPLRPDLAILDIGLPDDDGFALLAKLAAQLPELRQVLMSGRSDAGARVRARACGACGFITKTMVPARIVELIDAVLDGGEAFEDERRAGLPTLTVRQAEVLGLLAEGHGNKEIRHRMGIAERTVRAHLTELFQLLGAHSRMQAMIRAREFGLID